MTPLHWTSTLVLLTSLLAAQEDGPAPLRISVLGASVSAGFVDPVPAPDGERNESIDLANLLEQALPEGRAVVRQRASVATFLDPARHGGAQVERLARDEPDLVLAIDFPFWFGYGAHRDAESRLAEQRQCLELLGTLDVPVVVGDYPDMRGAVPRMLPRSHIPDPEALQALNETLHAWVAEQPHVHLFPLAEYVKRVKEEGQVVELEGRELEVPSEAILQGDRLHATRLGMALLTHRVLERACEVLPEDHPLQELRPDLPRLIEAARAGPDLAELESAGEKEEAEDEDGSRAPAAVGRG